MDGNGRWAKKRLFNRIKGHEKGINAVREVVTAGREYGLKALTLYAFSTENWNRPETEVKALMSLLKNFLVNERNELNDKNIKLQAIGDIDKLPEKVRKELEITQDLTSQNDQMVLSLALSYGSRDEITSAVKKIADKALSGELNVSDIDESTISGELYTKDLPDPDIVIRTSGEIRLSNFLMWQAAYSELFFTETLWPDFGKEEFHSILKDFQNRERRFGKV
ncbi:MAG: isoprenyl transferase [Desulfobacterales bacterium]|nr:isoprenyl transferase [Desulfobacterales bacterium]MCP4161531.1 isoprenyl transferase [Deltaproteobacteria bacterium]